MVFKKQLAQSVLGLIFASSALLYIQTYIVRHIWENHGKQYPKFQSKSSFSQKVCANLLENLTQGSWEMLPGSNVSVLDETYLSFWRSKKMLTKLWRDDEKCGYDNTLPKVPGAKWPLLGSWCDKNGPKPCCTNIQNGTCRPPQADVCNCKGCVDTRRYVHAELSKWKPNDPRCFWIHYDASQACDVIHTSQYDAMHFVGDSLMRNMFSAFMMLLSGDTVRGSWSKRMSEKQKELCVAERFFFWDQCRQIVRQFDDLLFPEHLCGGVRKPNFTANHHHFYSLGQSKKFSQLVQDLSGKKGSLVLVGIGLHTDMRASTVFNRYLGPALKIRDDFYKNQNVSLDVRWPRIFFMLPLLTGLLKPSQRIKTQNNKQTEEFAKGMRVYCEQHHIPLFDFRQLTRLVHSFDGSHFGLGVNLMKNQVLLNFIAQEFIQL